MEQKIIVVSVMHHRQKTVSYCLDQMPFLDVVMIYSDDEDGEFLKSKNVFATGKYKNTPLSFKWNAAIMSLEQIDFDAVILLGSDDYVDKAFVQFVSEKIKTHDMIGFTDAYYEKDGSFWHWSGYESRRKGEPVGAGKVYSKKFLERIKYNLYPSVNDVGLDYVAHNVCLKNDAKMLITNLKEHGLFLCDVKDGEGMNSLEKLMNHYTFTPHER